MSFEAPHPFDALTPDTLLDALEAGGFISDGRFLALNSYENRVYQIGMHDGPPVVAKFYRPGRWSDQTIIEEHAFALELAEHEIPVATPHELPGGGTLGRHAGFRYAVFRRLSGRAPELDDAETRVRLGRFLGRIHALGEIGRFRYRRVYDPARISNESLALLRERAIPAAHVAENYFLAAQQLIATIDAALAGLADPRVRRLHGDVHAGNILWTDGGPGFVDLDDCQMGPAVLDLWMLLSGNRDEMQGQLTDLLAGYSEFCDFDPSELALIEIMRGARFLGYAAWLGARYDDPAFPIAFPWFAQARFWEEQTQAMREQAERIVEPSIEWI